MSEDRIRLRRNPPNVSTPQGYEDLYVDSSGTFIRETAGGVKEEVGTGAPTTAAKISDAGATGISLLQSATPAAARDAAEAAPLSIIAAPSSPGATLLVHDDFSGPAQILVAASTRTVYPGPGTAKLASAPNRSKFSYENGLGLMTHSPPSGGGPVLHYGAQTIAAGLTFMVRTITEPHGAVWKVQVGFSDNETVRARRGALAIGALESPYNFGLLEFADLASDTDETMRKYMRGLYEPGQEIGIAVSYKSASHIEYFLQGGKFETLCPVGSDEWYKIGERTGLTATGTVYPYIYSQYNGARAITDVKVWSNWSPSNRHGCFDFSTTQLGVHVPTFGTDPVSGLLVLGWNKGTTHANVDSEIRYATRLAGGSWTDAATLLAAPGSPAGIQIQSFSVINGALWFIYYREPNALDGGVIYRRTMSVNPTTGAVTLGDEVLLGITGSRNLNFSAAVTLSNGRIILPYHKADGSPALNSYMAVSDDNGITWTEEVVAASLPGGTTLLDEPTILVESDGMIGGYFRTSANVAYYARTSASPLTGLLAWTTPAAVKAISQPGATGARMQALRTSDGRMFVVGNDDRAGRRRATLWEVGDNAVILAKHLIVDAAQQGNADPSAQYPTIAELGGDFHIAYSSNPSSGGELTCAIQRHQWSLSDPVAVSAGGTGVKSAPVKLSPRESPVFNKLVYGTAPVPDLTYGNKWEITLTDSTATIGVPLNPLNYQEMEVVVIQGGSGSYTLAWNAVFQFNGITTTLQTAVGAANIFRFRYVAATEKWVLISFS